MKKWTLVMLLSCLAPLRGFGGEAACPWTAYQIGDA